MWIVSCLPILQVEDNFNQNDPKGLNLYPFNSLLNESFQGRFNRSSSLTSSTLKIGRLIIRIPMNDLKIDDLSFVGLASLLLLILYCAKCSSGGFAISTCFDLSGWSLRIDYNQSLKFGNRMAEHSWRKWKRELEFLSFQCLSFLWVDTATLSAAIGWRCLKYALLM